MATTGTESARNRADTRHWAASHHNSSHHNGPVTTLVFCHAHPDDEALLTAGTMARAAAEGHRVVLVVATDGAAGLTSSDLTSDLAERRHRELEASARALGVARVVTLGYADSGLHAENAHGFAHLDPREPAHRVAAVLDEEDADVLIGYDPSGGYGHPDHIQVHRTARAARDLARRRPRMFEATLPREPFARGARIAVRSGLVPDDFDPTPFVSAGTPTRGITHRVDVRNHLDAKRASLSAHASQAVADDQTRTLAVLLRLPRPLFRALLGREFYVAVP